MSGCAVFVMLEQPNEPVAADDVGCVIGLAGLVYQFQAVEWSIAQPLVRPLIVVVVDVLVDEVSQMPFPRRR